ncbi:hypothetical protein HPB49_007044 [Dermacentor silvarum]|uniref:Uncharacterized protein n=1 Tax=Dermacentor silvarum TaxID=543639 RepID=A0ACB8D3C2_DERSI|nr:hypothetical protein HPB49_007044 [Dermacentor silvarum]
MESQDTVSHGGWWELKAFEEYTGPIAIEFTPYCYVSSQDNGLFVLGGPHPPGEGPFPEEILTAVKLSDTKIALKSGYGKYLSVQPDGTVVGRSDAIGPLEQWEPVFQDGKVALLASNSCFLTVVDGPGVEVRIEEVFHKTSNPREYHGQRRVPTDDRATREDPLQKPVTPAVLHNRCFTAPLQKE